MEITSGDILFLDTNILLSATDESRSNHRLARWVISSSHHYGVHLAISGQIEREYLVVATRRSDANGLGLDPEDACRNIHAMRRRMVLFEEVEPVAGKLTLLTRKHALRGVRIHDANVVVTMVTHGISKLVTENEGDFSMYPEIQTVNLPDLYFGGNRST